MKIEGIIIVSFWLPRPHSRNRTNLSSECPLNNVDMHIFSPSHTNHQGFDEYMNIVLDEAEEVTTKTGAKRTIGRILLKGDCITLMQRASTEQSSSDQH